MYLCSWGTLVTLCTTITVRVCLAIRTFVADFVQKTSLLFLSIGRQYHDGQNDSWDQQKFVHPAKKIFMKDLTDAKKVSIYSGDGKITFLIFYVFMFSTVTEDWFGVSLILNTTYYLVIWHTILLLLYRELVHFKSNDDENGCVFRNMVLVIT